MFHIGSAESDDYQPGVEVHFITLQQKTVFDKTQSRSGGVARQRVCDGTVLMEASSPVRQILGIKVWVTREKEAAELHKDRNGAVQLQVSYGQQNIDKVSFLLIIPLIAEVRWTGRHLCSQQGARFGDSDKKRRQWENKETIIFFLTLLPYTIRHRKPSRNAFDFSRRICKEGSLCGEKFNC